MSSTGKKIHEDSVIKTFFKSYDYTKDPDYADWEKQLYSENDKFTFEQTLSFCKIYWFKDTWFKDTWFKETKKKWLNCIQEWNMTRYEKESKDHSEISIVGYAAVTYLYVVLPYDKILSSSCSIGERSIEISEFQAKLINICLLHETGKNLVVFKDYDMLTISDPPDHPDAFEEFLNEQYNSACWFLTFLVYLNQKKIDLGHKGALWT